MSMRKISNKAYVRLDGLLVYRGQDGEEYHAEGPAKGTMPGSRAEFARISAALRIAQEVSA